MKGFLDYYREELISLRQSGKGFSKKYPEIAGRLDINGGESMDPQTERIIESVAFMAAKLNQKIDGNVQLIAFHLLTVLYPNLVNQFPSCGIVRFDSSVKVSTSDKVFLPKGTCLFANSRRKINCTFKTVYPINLYPIKVIYTGITTVPGYAYEQFIEVRMNTKSVPFEQINIHDILFHISSEILEDSLLVYEALFLGAEPNVLAKIGDAFFKIDKDNFIQCGFRDDETVCPVHKYTSNTLQLFQEFLHFKRKFMFFRILNLDKLIKNSSIESINEISVFLKIHLINEKLLSIVGTGTIITDAVPIANLFKVTSDPFRFDGTKSKYLLVADQSRDKSIEIHSISEITMMDVNTQEPRAIQPYFSLTIDADTNVIHDVFWMYTREPSEIRGLNGFDTYISLIETRMNPQNVYANIVYATTLCTNRFEALDIPTHGRMEIENADSAGYFGTLLYRMTLPASLIDDNDSLWNLVSQISATHISVADGGRLLSSLSKLLEVFACGAKLKQSEILDGIGGVDIRKTVRRIGTDAWRGFVSGLEAEIFINDNEVSPGKFLLFSVLNQYLSSSISINSFIELSLKSKGTNKKIARWRPTSGRRDLL
jgi:type VI secretion system protein ImpG